MSAVPTFEWFPASLEEVSPEWITSVLRANGIDVEVESFSGKKFGTGQLGYMVRATLEYRGGRPPNAPETLIFKLPSSDPTSKGTGVQGGIYLRESEFYRYLAPAMRERGARIAKCYASEFSLEREATILVLEDLYPAEQGDQLHGCSIEDAELGIKQAARIHATFWGADSPILENVKWLTGRDKSAPTLIQMFTPVFIERYKSRMTPDMEALLTKFAPLASAWLEELSHGPRTVVHGDYRIDNLLFAPKDRDSADRYCYTVDWQTPALGRAGYDIGYFLGASLLPEERAKHEERLVKLYHDELVAQGVKDYPFDLLFKDYRKGQMAGMIMAVIASNVVVRTERGDEMFWTMFHRHYEAGKHVNVEELFPTI